MALNGAERQQFPTDSAHSDGPALTRRVSSKQSQSHWTTAEPLWVGLDQGLELSHHL